MGLSWFTNTKYDHTKHKKWPCSFTLCFKKSGIKTDMARDKPLKLAAIVQSGFTERLDADRAYADVLMKTLSTCMNGERHGQILQHMIYNTS